MNTLRIPVIVSLITLILTASSVTAQPSDSEDYVDQLIGIWTIDLRPKPDADAFLKTFEVKTIKSGKMKGSFYDTKFTNGRVDTHWDVLYFAFTTKDNSGVYFHSGTFDGKAVKCISYSENREFVSPWFSVKREN